MGQTMSISGSGNVTIASVQDASHLTLASSPGTLTNAQFWRNDRHGIDPRQDMYYLSLNANASLTCGNR